MPEIAAVWPRQAGQYAVVVQPAHDDLAGPLDNGVPLQGGIDVDLEDVAVVVLSAHAEVGQAQGGDGMVADLGQSFPALGVGSQDLRGLAEPVQAVEPLADQPRALQRRSLGDQRLAQGEPGLTLGLRGQVELMAHLILRLPKVVALTAECPRRHRRADRDQDRQRRGQRDQRRQGDVPLAPPPEPLVERDGPRPDRPALQVSPQLIAQLSPPTRTGPWGPWPAP